MNNIIKNRSELLFCYDVTDANPNGDPLDDNKPRIDEETGINFVTDVRLKRTIRDYLYEFKGFNGEDGRDIFVRQLRNDEGYVKDVKQRIRDFVKADEPLSQEEKEIVEKHLCGKISKVEAQALTGAIGKTILNENIDTRLFGATYAVEIPKNKIVSNKEFKGSITYTGPVQFKMGRSLHKVEVKSVGHSFTMASAQEKQQGSLAPEYVLYYSFITFHGIINQNAAKHTGMTEEDEKLLLDAIWHGTKNLISRSKFGQQPRFLLKITYKTPNFFIGDLDKKIKMTEYDNELKIRNLKDFRLNMEELVSSIENNSHHVLTVEYQADSNLRVDIPDEWQNLNM